MSAQGPATASPLAALLHLESRARGAADRTALEFVVANETWQLAPYRQAMVFRPDARGRLAVSTVSGLAVLEGDTPFTVWLARLAAHCAGAFDRTRAFTPAELPAELREDWAEWLPEHALYAPLVSPGGERLGAVLYARDAPWEAATVALLARLHEAYGHAAWALSAHRSLGARLRGAVRRSRWWVTAAAVIAIAALFLPVRMSVLAPAEVVALDAEVVAAPMDGVVERFNVAPNQPVKKGDIVLTLDRTSLASKREVAVKALEVARADALLAAQKAFDSDKSRADLAVLQGKVREREAEVAYLDGLLARVEVRAPRDGIVVFADPNDWIGKPVVTGERIALLADPASAGVLAWLPVVDAINLEPGAEIRLFLHVAPLSPFGARLEETSYQATPSPEGIAAYRVRGKFEAAHAEARIGLKGTAKVYGDRVPLAYLLLRRPLAALREWTGL